MKPYDDMSIDELTQLRETELDSADRMMLNFRLGERRAARDAILDLSEDLSEQGWVCVPERPTDEMVIAGYRSPLGDLCKSRTFADEARWNMGPAWEAMLSAAPSPGETGNG